MLVQLSYAQRIPNSQPFSFPIRSSQFLYPLLLNAFIFIVFFFFNSSIFKHCKFSILRHYRISETSNIFLRGLNYIEDITRRREDMNFIFEWPKQYFTNERSE